MPSKNWRFPVTEKERAGVIREVVARVAGEKIALAAQSPDNALDNVINDVLYHEKQRAKIERTDEMKEELRFLTETARKFPDAGEEARKSMLESIIEHYADDVAGHFDPKVFAFTTRILPYGLEALFNAASPMTLLRNPRHFPDLQSRIIIRGDIALLKKLARRGALVITPTHASNLDSVVVGWALNEVGLPPVNYGAAKTLFSNPALSYFMNSLGAYKVDRRITHALYKEVLKTYSVVLIEQGRHSLYFPGGTRSRSGMVEKKLKLGLLGTAITAYVNNLIREAEKPNIYIVPLTINYPIALEGETLIDDYLQEIGKSRYIITDDEFSKPAKVLKLTTSLMAMDSSMALQFGRPLDVLGHEVDDEGVSMDARGRNIDLRGFFMDTRGGIVRNAERDVEYTRELGEALVRAFHRNTVVLSTHALAFTLFRMLLKSKPGADLYRLLRFEGEGMRIPVRDALSGLERLIARLLELETAGRIKLGGAIRPGECARETMYKALRFFSMYHTKPVVVRKGDYLEPMDLNLLYFYHNRLVGWDLETLFETTRITEKSAGSD